MISVGKFGGSRFLFFWNDVERTLSAWLESIYVYILTASVVNMEIG